MPIIKINGIDIHYIDIGTGEVIFFMHGLTGSNSDWQAQINAVKSDCRCIAMDFRGHGQTGAPPLKEDYSIYHFRDDALKLLDSLGVKRCLLTGHSMGGFTALQIAIDRPDIVAGLVLADTTSGERQVVPGYADILARMEQLARTQGIEAAFNYDAANNPMRIERYAKHPELRSISLRKALKTSIEGYIFVPMSFSGWQSVTDRLNEIKQPALIFCGGDDTAFLKASEVLHEKIRNSEMVVVPGAAHNPHEEKPMIFNEHFLKFLHRLDFCK